MPAGLLTMLHTRDTDVRGEAATAWPKRRWEVAAPDPASADELARLLKVSGVVGQVLLNRGFTPGDPQAAREFLTPRPRDLLAPADIPGLPAAADRITRALRNDEPLVIHGDYDVDGVTATSILWHAFTLLTGKPDKVATFIPHRIDDGYGLAVDTVDKLADAGHTLVVTVDCGITACAAADRARARGVDLIITDHHEPTSGDDGSPVLPDALLVHPRLPGSTYANGDLTGAGVAFKLAWEVARLYQGGDRVSDDLRQFLVEAMALAALGTVADVAPLRGENRVIAAFGLGGVKTSSLRGLRALVESAGLDGQEIDSYHAGFLLGPRLNACGRMGHAAMAVEMLTTAGPGRAREIAQFLESQNRQRQTTEKAIIEQAAARVVEEGRDKPDCPAVVVDGRGWHLGVVGIVASRLVDRFHKPAVVLAVDDENRAGGSARSIDGLHLAQTLAACGDLLDSHGGHAMAAGLRLRADRIDAFRERFTLAAAKVVTPEMLVPRLRVDAEVRLEAVTHALATEVARLGPFGPGNRKPIFVTRGAVVLSARSVGRTGDHLQLQIHDPAAGESGRPVKGIAFGAGPLARTLRGGDRIDLAFEPQLNVWNGRTSVELMVKDLSPG